MTRVASITWVWGLVILFLVAAFHFHSVHSTYMRADEEIAYRSTQYDMAYTVRFQAERDVHAPLWFASFWLWQQFMGDSEFMGRVFSIILSMMTMALVYPMGRRWLGAARYGLFGMAALGVNAFFFIYSLEIRPYAMVMLAATISMWRFWGWLEQETWQAALWYGVTLAVMLYIHYFLFFLVIVQALFFLWGVGRDIHSVQRFRIWRQGIGVGALAFALWLPWLPVFIGQILTLRRLEAASGRGMGIANTTEPTSWAVIVDLMNTITNGQPGLYSLVLLIGVVSLWRSTGYRLALLWGLGVPVIALVLNLVASVYTQRYITYLSVGLALAVGGGLAVSAELIQRLLNRHPAQNAGHRDTKFAKLISLTAVVGFAVVGLYALPSQLPMDRIPYRDLLINLSDAAQPGDVILFDQADQRDNFAQWQYRHYLPPELWANASTDKNVSLAARRIWHITANWFDEAVRATFTEIEWTHPRQSGFGNCDRNWCYLIQLMEAPPWDEPAVFGEHMAFWGADVDSVDEETVRTRLWWRVEQAPELNYSMSLQLLDSSGGLVAQADGPINHFGAEIVETSRLEPGRIYIDHRPLTLPPGLPSGEYRLALVVYQSWDGARLTLADGTDALVVNTIPVP